MLSYRREIDGLRALAVIPVILFHAGFQSFSGGYVGVDVFFVISGYLITSIIINEKQAGTFTLLNFYERRARRILPALFIVMFTCLPFAWLWLLPADLKWFSQSVFSVSGFSSNFLFYLTSGYFDTPNELKPLLHTWSLAVEEQYYILFPLFLVLSWRFGKMWIVAVLAVVAVVSLCAAQWGSIKHPSFTFYLLPMRGWEILMGAFIAFYFAKPRRQNINRSVSQAGSIVGILLVVFAVFYFDRNTPFPSLYALAPTIGTVLIILFATQQTLIGKLLSNKLFVGLGLISYSTYLWHQPIFAFARYRSQEEPGKLLLSMLAIAAVVFAYFSWKYVEAPFRSKHRFNRNQIFMYCAIGTLFFMAIGLIGYLNDGFRSRLPPNLVWSSLGEKLDKDGDICELTAIRKYPGVLACEFGDKKSSKTVFLYGDSHAQAISEELDKYLIISNLKGIRVHLDGCETVPQIHTAADVTNIKGECDKYFENMLSYIKATASAIILASRWTFRLYPIKGEIDNLSYVNSEGGRERNIEYREYVSIWNGKPSIEAADKRRDLHFLIGKILSTGVKSYIIYPIPEIGVDIARANVSYYKKNDSVLEEISIPHKDYSRRNRFVIDIFNDFESVNNFVPIKPELIFCDSLVKGRCVAQYGSIPFYYDGDHLSDVGAHFVVDEIFKNGPL